MYRIADPTGMTFGRLTVLGYDHSAKKKAYYRCRCECGKEAVVYSGNLTSGKTRSCGCLRGESVAMIRGHFPKVEITEKQKAWIIKHFKHTRNEEIKEKFGISDGWLHRFARKNGLKKSPQFMTKVQMENAQKAAFSHRMNGTYPPKGYRIPRSGVNCFKKGVTPLERLGPKREAERVRKSAESRKKTWKLEHARWTFGLPRETKLRVFKQPREWASRRYYLRQLGYVIERGGLDAYWGGNTRRNEKLEAGYRPFRFHPITELEQPNQ